VVGGKDRREWRSRRSFLFYCCSRTHLGKLVGTQFDTVWRLFPSFFLGLADSFEASPFPAFFVLSRRSKWSDDKLASAQGRFFSFFLTRSGEERVATSLSIFFPLAEGRCGPRACLSQHAASLFFRRSHPEPASSSYLFPPPLVSSFLPSLFSQSLSAVLIC